MLEFAQTVAVSVTALAAATALIVTLVSYKRDAKRRQNDNLFRTITWFENHRQDLEAVIAFQEKPLSKWTPAELDSANRVSWGLHFIGGLVRFEAISPAICELYYYSIISIRIKLDKYLEHLRKERDASYFWKIEDLVIVARLYNKDTPYALDICDDYKEFYARYDKIHSEKDPHLIKIATRNFGSKRGRIHQETLKRIQELRVDITEERG